MQSAAIPHPSDAERLLGQLAADSAALLRCEIELSAAERVPELRRQALDGAQAALAVVCLLLAAAALSWAAVVSMSNVMPNWASPLLVSAGWLGAGAILIHRLMGTDPGRGMLWRAGPEELDEMLERCQRVRDAAEARVRVTSGRLASELVHAGLDHGIEDAMHRAESEIVAIENGMPILSDAAGILIAPGRLGITLIARALRYR
jgi:hypothetical protein